jgi:hypothetical protein
MKRTEHKSEGFDYTPFLRAIIQLDIALKRGITINVGIGIVEVDDTEVSEALKHVTQLIGSLTDEMDKATRMLARAQASTTVLQ